MALIEAIKCRESTTGQFVGASGRLSAKGKAWSDIGHFKSFLRNFMLHHRGIPASWEVLHLTIDGLKVVPIEDFMKAWNK